MTPKPDDRKKVLLLSRYENLGASSRIRMYQYIPYLSSQGIDVTVSPLLDNRYLADLYSGRRLKVWPIISAYLYRLGRILKSHQYDLLWIEKELFPWLPSFMEKMPEFLNIPYVLDLDDAIFHSYDEHRHRAVRLILEDKIRKVVAGAAWTVVGNPYLQRYARRITTRVSVIPSVIDQNRYSGEQNPVSHNGVFTIGWIGSPATANCIETIIPVLRTFCSARKSRVLLVGSGNVDMPGVPVEFRPWSEETELDDIMEFDVGIMPLSDIPWHRGKSGFKLIQYMASGKPVIASPVGVNSLIVKDRENGYIAKTEAEWLEALRILHDHPDKRLHMGRIGRKNIENSFCFQVTAPRLLDVIRKSFHAPPRRKPRSIIW